MCGILVYTQASDLTRRLTPSIRNRGPDYYGSITSDFVFESSVLGLREPFTKQPIQQENHVLCYNGQVYGVKGSDTTYFFDILRTVGGVRKVFDLNGEFAFVYYDGTDLYFARDTIGKRSLLFSLGDDSSGNGIVISSVGEPGFKECEAGVLYKWNADGLTETRVANKLLVNRRAGTGSRAQFLEILKSAVDERMVVPSSHHSSIAVLFSGGLDCTILARLMDLVLPPQYSIELLNVAFENKRTGAKFETPDRKLGIRSHKELTDLSTRDIKFIKIDVPYDEAISYYEKVGGLMYPKSTVMDLSIALAFFCASRATPESKSRVLISGLGADELFGGYSRHTRAAEQGPEVLADELDLDFNRLGERNLGRDDRVCSDCGKEVRYPFLDPRVIKAALATDLTLKASKDDTKILLRQVARDLGLNAVALEKKRAIQFGAKTAKMDPGSGRSKGTDSLN